MNPITFLGKIIIGTLVVVIAQLIIWGIDITQFFGTEPTANDDLHC